jgi:hypothetical protein
MIFWDGRVRLFRHMKYIGFCLGCRSGRLRQVTRQTSDNGPLRPRPMEVRITVLKFAS